MAVGKPARQVHLLMPAIGNRHQPWVQRTAQAGHQRRQGIVEILVLATAETVAGHDHLRAKGFRLAVQGADLITGLVAQQRRDNRAAVLIELLFQQGPVQPVQILLAHCRALRLSRWPD
ncbi:hypothetical protein D3C79_868050 [compost metagenome]